MRPTTSSLAVCLVGCALLVLAQRTIAEPLGGIVTSLIFLGTILAAGILGGWKAGIVATTIGILAATMLFSPPYFSRAAHNAIELVRLISFLLLGVTLSAICELLQRAWGRIDDRQRRLEAEVQERRKAQLAEQARADELLTTLAGIGDGVIRTDGAGRVLYLNPVAEQLVGWTTRDAAGRMLPDIFHIVSESTRQPLENPALRALRGGSAASANHAVLISRNGTERPIDDSAAPIRDALGTVIGSVLIFRDIGERQRAQTALRASESRFRALMEQAPFSIQVLSPEGRTLSVNRAWEELWGLTPAQLGDYNILEDPQLEAKGVLDVIRRGFAGETVRVPAIEYDPSELVPAHARQRDLRRWVSAVLYPLRDDLGRVREVVLVHDDITARKRAEAELAESTHASEQQRRIYESALSNTADFNYVFDLEGRFVYVNKALLDLWGKRLADAAGRNFVELGYPAELAARLQRQIQQVIDTKLPLRDETPYTSAAGERQYEYIFVPVLGVAGNIEAVAGSTRDVTERKEMERELQHAHHRLEEALTAGAIATWSWELESDRVFADAKLAEWFGVSAAEAAGGPLAAFVQTIHADDRERVNSIIRRAVEQGAEYEADYRLAPPRGTVRWVVARGRIERDPAGRPVRMAGVLVDISSRKEAERALLDSERRYRAIGESIDYGVWICDAQGRNTYASESFLRLVGLTQEECSTFGWGKVLHPDDAQATIAAWQECVRAGDRWDREHRFKGVDGNWHYVLARGVPVKNEQGEITAWVGINLDIGRLKEVEAELRDADRRKDEFLATLAHELRNPLAPIGNSLQILKMPMVDAETARQSRDMMERQVQHLVRLVDDLLDVSRVMRGKIELRPERVELATVVARAVETAQPAIEVQRHQLEISLPPVSLPLQADPVRLAQVIGNLLTNAAKYTEAEGHIRLTARQDGDLAVLSVQDDGIGIAPDMLPHIFELFVQADHSSTKSQGGLGIGLTLVRNLVEMHGGSVEAQSAGLGQGSEFVVRLPLVRDAATKAAGSEPPRALPAPTPSGLQLLVVDDNRDAADSLAMLLRIQGHDVRVAHSGADALELAAARPPDLILLDIGMPGMDGYEVARRLRQTAGLERTVLAALTGWGQAEDRRRTSEAGFDRHLVKPVEHSVLESLLAELKSSRA